MFIFFLFLFFFFKQKTAYGMRISDWSPDVCSSDLSVMRLGSDERAPVAVIPTGSIALDVALGVGGLPRGRIIEIYGPESSGKTTLTLHAIANVQQQGGIAAFIDAEHALDPDYAQKLGVDIDALLVSQPDTGEQAQI